MNTFNADKSARVADNIFNFVRSATKQVTRAGVASEIEEQMRKRDLKGPVVIVTEVGKVREAWMRLVGLPKNQQLYRFLPVVVDFKTYEAMMDGSDIREWIVVFDDMGSGSEAYARYSVRMRRSVAVFRPKLCMFVSKPPARSTSEEFEDLAQSLMPPPKVTADESPSFKLYPHQKHAMAWLRNWDGRGPVTLGQMVAGEVERSYPETTIRTEHTSFYADQGDGIIVTCVKSQFDDPGCRNGYHSRWPKYAIVGDRVFMRAHSREDVVDRLFPRVTAAYQYKLLEGPAAEEAKGDVKELLEALVYPDVK